MTTFDDDAADYPVDDATASLVRSAQQGDRRAFRALYERLHRRVFRTAVRLLGDRVRAEDAVQDVFIMLYKRLDEFDFRSSFSTWVYRITVNACYAVMRKQERRGKYHASDRDLDETTVAFAGEGPDTAMSREEIRHYLEKGISHLSPDLRATFVLRQMERLSYREIGQVLDVAPGTVASRLARARDQLAEMLRDLGIDETYLE